MIQPYFAACWCSHPHADHPDRGSMMCLAPGCDCLDYRPQAIGGKRTDPRPPSLRSLLKAGRESTRLRTRQRVARVELEIATLLRDLRAERDAASIAAGRRATSKSTRKGVTFQRGKTCDVCGRGDLANVGVHKYHAHGIRAGAA